MLRLLWLQQTASVNSPQELEEWARSSSKIYLSDTYLVLPFFLFSCATCHCCSHVISPKYNLTQCCHLLGRSHMKVSSEVNHFTRLLSSNLDYMMEKQTLKPPPWKNMFSYTSLCCLFSGHNDTCGEFDTNHLNFQYETVYYSNRVILNNVIQSRDWWMSDTRKHLGIKVKINYYWPCKCKIVPWLVSLLSLLCCTIK